MTKLEIGQTWYTPNGKPVDITAITEYTVTLKTYSGFVFTYDYRQFLDEYIIEVQYDKLAR